MPIDSIITEEEKEKQLDRLQASCIPNMLNVSKKEIGKIQKRKGYKKKELVNLKELPENTIILLDGTHAGAGYTLRILANQKVAAWRNLNANGFDIPIKYISSYEAYDKEKIKSRMGTLKCGSQFFMPYFYYKENNLQKPESLWGDRCIELYLKIPRKKILGIL